MGRLRNSVALSFTRYGDSDIDENGYETSGELPDKIEAIGSLQPLGIGLSNVIASDGIDVKGAYRYYTDTKLNMVDEYEGTIADTTEIDGLTYEVYDIGNWYRSPLRKPAHYKVILIRRSKRRGD